ncbi:hypothetical protein [Scytonema sp. HK-05]|uniref:hypothetical protein n=1 Tax=Scytonema sp. HK-05 TaxID=1137095 RepID=UPI0013016AD2|nr:hypothetical protein [Scytonema sp. HK-05]
MTSWIDWLRSPLTVTSYQLSVSSSGGNTTPIGPESVGGSFKSPTIRTAAGTVLKAFLNSPSPVSENKNQDGLSILANSKRADRR